MLKPRQREWGPSCEAATHPGTPSRLFTRVREAYTTRGRFANTGALPLTHLVGGEAILCEGRLHDAGNDRADRLQRQLAFTAAHHSIGWRTYRHKQHHVTSCGVYGRLDCRRICRLFHGSSGLRDSGWEAHNKSVRRAEQMRKAPGSAPAACSLVKVGKVGIVEAIITEATTTHAQTGTGFSTDERFAQKITRRRAIREP